MLDQIHCSVLPERITLFGLMHLAPAYLDLLKRLADFIEIYGFVLNPCCEYWAKTESTLFIRQHNYPEAIGDLLLNQLGHKGSIFCMHWLWTINGI